MTNTQIVYDAFLGNQATSDEIAVKTKIPLKVVRSIIHNLKKQRRLIPVDKKGKNYIYETDYDRISSIIDQVLDNNALRLELKIDLIRLFQRLLEYNMSNEIKELILLKINKFEQKLEMKNKEVKENVRCV